MKRAALFAALLIAAGCALAQAGKVEVQWLGQAAFRITTPGGKVIVTDSWLLKNPITPPEYKKLEALGKVDLLLMPIGGHFTMDPADAAYATRELMKPKFVIPMHYGTNPMNKGTPQEYMQALGAAPTKVYALKPGEKVEF